MGRRCCRWRVPPWVAGVRGDAVGRIRQKRGPAWSLFTVLATNSTPSLSVSDKLRPLPLHQRPSVASRNAPRLNISTILIAGKGRHACPRQPHLSTVPDANTKPPTRAISGRNCAARCRALPSNLRSAANRGTRARLAASGDPRTGDHDEAWHLTGAWVPTSGVLRHLAVAGRHACPCLRWAWF